MNRAILPYPTSVSRTLHAAVALLLACCVMLAAPAARAQATPASVTAQTVIVTPLSLIRVNNLDFGTIAPRPTAGTVALDPISNICSTTGALQHVGNCTPASFAGMGSRNMVVRINVAGNTNLTGPGRTMVLDNMTLKTAPDLTVQVNGNGNGNNAGNGNTRYQIVPPSGIFTFAVGGTLHVDANQGAGAYSGSFTVQVQYQ